MRRHEINNSNTPPKNPTKLTNSGTPTALSHSLVLYTITPFPGRVVLILLFMAQTRKGQLAHAPPPMELLKFLQQDKPLLTPQVVQGPRQQASRLVSTPGPLYPVPELEIIRSLLGRHRELDTPGWFSEKVLRISWRSCKIALRAPVLYMEGVTRRFWVLWGKGFGRKWLLCFSFFFFFSLVRSV